MPLVMAGAKEEMSAFDVRAAVRELKLLKGSRIDKAYEIAPGELSVRLRVMKPQAAAEPGRGADAPEARQAPSRKVDLTILVGKALFINTRSSEAPEKPTPFVMNLRKSLANAFVDDVRQLGFDRVIEFVSDRKDAKYRLIIELFHDGNVVLVKDDKIAAALKHQSWATREVRPGAPWVAPPARQDPYLMSDDEFAARLRASNADVVRTLATEANLGGALAEEVCARSGLDKRALAAALGDTDIKHLLATLRALMDVADIGALDPVIVKRAGAPVDVSPVPFAAHAGDAEFERFPTFHAALDAYFGKPQTAEAPRADPRLKKLQGERAKLDRMLAAQEGALTKFAAEDAESRRKGDLLYGHFADAQRVMTAILDASKTVGWPQVAARVKEGKIPRVESVDANNGTAVLSLDDPDGKKARVKVDLRKSVQENADAMYEHSKKFREKRKGALVAIEHTRRRLKELDERGAEVAAELEARGQKRASVRKFWFENFRWFFTSDGHLVLAGRDARSNEKLVAQRLEDNDRYLHADVSGAPSTVVKAKDGAVSEAALEEAACFAASMSRTWSAGHASGEAYWVTPQQVSKTPNPGEFVAKGSFIIRGKRNFVRAPIRLAVGQVEVEGVKKIMSGPPAALAARSTRYVVIEPGQLATNQLANELSKIFDVGVEDAQAAMPPGPVKIVERVGL